MIKKAMFVLLTAAAPVLALEGLARLLPDRLFARQYWIQLHQSDAQLPFRFRPNAAVSQDLVSVENPGVMMKMNSRGFRDREFTLEKSPRTLRILALGDSFTYGWLVHAQESWPKQLEKLLNQPRILQKFGSGIDQVEVINAGGFYSADVQYLYLKTEGRSFKPDIVVAGAFLYNDIADIAYNSQWERVTQNGLPEKIGLKKNSYYFSPQKTKIKKMIEPWIGRSRLVCVLVDSVNKFRMLASSAFSSTGKSKPSAASVPYEELDVLGFYREPLSPEMERAWEQWQKVSLGMKAVCDEMRARLIFMMIPIELQVYSEKSSSEWQYVGKNLELSEIQKDIPQKRMSAFLKRREIESLDLLPRFRERAAIYPPESLYFPMDRHWTALGHQTAAESLFRFLTADQTSQNTRR